MTDDGPFQHRPAEFKTALDGEGGLVRIPLQGGLHAGRELYIDEREIPEEIFATPRREPFEWWPERLSQAMATTELGRDPSNPPIRYVLQVADDSGEPRYVAEATPA